MRMLQSLRGETQTNALPSPGGKILREHSTVAARTDREVSNATSAFAWNFRNIDVFPAARVYRSIPIQTKLAIGPANDPLEHEADHVADQVMRGPPPSASFSAAPPRIRRQCTACEDEEVQRKTAGAVQANSAEAPEYVHDVLQSPGQPLDIFSRAFFESRFGHDFSQVRVHTDEKAAQSARAMNARAYSSGTNLVFDSGQYSPQSDEGRRLLAHELTHVVQQTNAGSSSTRVQRQPRREPKKPTEKKPPTRQNIVLLGEGWTGGRELSTVLASGGQVIAVTSVKDAAAALAKVDGPIGTLYFVTHSTNDGSLKFGKSEGYTKATDIAKELKGSVAADKAPQTVDFRGCSVGTSPAAMEDIRNALGAQSVVAGNCYAVIDMTTPIKMGPENDMKEITQAFQVTEKNRKKFNELYQSTLEKFIAKIGSKKSCVLTKSKDDFFKAGGRFVALWFNSSFSGEWIKDQSVCYQDAKHKIVDPAKPAEKIEGCTVITVNAPAKAEEKK